MKYIIVDSNGMCIVDEYEKPMTFPSKERAKIHADMAESWRTVDTPASVKKRKLYELE